MLTRRWFASAWLCGGLLAALFVFATVGPAADDAAPPAENPYSPRKGATVAQLKAHIERLQSLPEAIRERPGFTEGVLEAADGILAGKPEESLRVFAALNKLQALHFLAVKGDATADDKLVKQVDALKDDKDEQVKTEVAFLRLEQKVLSADNLKPDELAKLVAEVEQFFAAAPGTNRHLRLASATVKLINRLPGDDAADKAYKGLGGLWAKSEDRELSRYGRKIEKGAKPATLVGKPMPIAGTTSAGDAFDIKQFQGKIVLVDFWATWCGPCVASLPALKEAHEAYHKKGFEIVGISLDQDFDKLKEFIEEEKLPWISLVGEKGADDAVAFPLAEKYGVQAIPTTYLIGRDGKVIAENPHGEELTKHLEKLLGPVDKPASEKKPDDKKEDAAKKDTPPKDPAK